MTNQKKLEVIEEAFNYYHDRNSLTSKDEKELLNLVNELYAAISVTRCCTELKDKESISFSEWKIIKFTYNNGLYNDLVNRRKFYTQAQILKKYNTEIQNL